jgi:ribosome-binding protein aMBF1 (putative translation factor)
MDHASSIAVAGEARDEDRLAPLLVAASSAGVPRIQALRNHRGLSVEQLAQKAGITAADVNRLEAGERILRYSALTAVAAALDVPVRLLVD